MVNPDYRGIGEFTFASGTYTASVPFTLAVFVGGSMDAVKDAGKGWQNYTSKTEIDFGDGAGWQDVTADRFRWDRIYGDGIDLSTWTQHVYTTPGSYTPDIRVTYWDGEVLHHLPDTVVHITILPPESGT
jgi:hypothetical protein